MFRARHRPGLLVAGVAGTGATVAAVALATIWLRTAVVPPDCASPRTLARVHRSLVEEGLPEDLTIGGIRTLAGGYLAFRFACEADLDGIAPAAVRPGTPIPRSVHYVSRLSGPGGEHEVTIRIRPLLRLERVQ